VSTPALEEDVFRAQVRIALELDRATVPYAFAARIAKVGASLDDATMQRYGADAAGVREALGALQAAADAAQGAPYSDCAFDHAREAVRILEDEVTALSVAEGTVGPHEQVQQDLLGLEGAIGWLEQRQAVQALAQLSRVGVTGVAAIESRETFDLELLYRDPDYENVSWASEGQFPELLDLYDVWHTIAAKGQGGMQDFGAEITELSAHVATASEQYRARILQLAGTLRAAAAALDDTSTCTP